MSESDAVLLVEGPDDREFVLQLCTAHGVSRGSFKVDPKGGWPKIRRDFDETLGVARKTGLKTVGLIVDADTDPAGRWGSLRPTLQKLWMDVPDAPVRGGMVQTCTDGVRVGVWLMPDNGAGGALEDLAARLVTPGDLLLDHAARVVDALPERRFGAGEGARSKAVIHTWLAWQNEPGRPLGAAIQKKYLDAGAAGGQALAAWLKRLFVE